MSLEISQQCAKRVIDGEAGMSSLDRRRFLQASAAVGARCWPPRSADLPAAARIEVPAVDRIVVQEVTDGAHDVFLRGSEHPPCRAAHWSQRCEGQNAPQRVGLALHIDPKGAGSTSLSVGFRLHPRGVCQQPEIMKIDPVQVDALILATGILTITAD